MSIRPFDWRDLPSLHRYRKQSVFLNSALLFTRGPMIIAGSMLSSLTPSVGIFTSVSTDNGDIRHPLIGQVIHTAGDQVAQLTFLSPEDAMQSPALLDLLEHLSAKAIERGALRLLAEADEGSLAYEVLRQNTFAIYTRQRIWRIDTEPTQPQTSLSWQVATDKDLIAVRSLHNNIVPGLVQQVEPFPEERLHGMVYHEKGEILAFVELKYGHKGIYAQPFIDPDAEHLVPELVKLLPNVPNRRARPVYACVRSYNSWLESAFDEMAAQEGPSQAVMVKHMAMPQKAARAFVLPALESGHPEATVPMVHSSVAPTQVVQSEK
jgi:hypothetical protein